MLSKQMLKCFFLSLSIRIIKNLNTLSIIIVHINFLFMINYHHNNLMVQEGIYESDSFKNRIYEKPNRN